MKKKIIIAGLIFLTIANMTSLSIIGYKAFHHSFFSERHCRAMHGNTAQSLRLTPSQSTDIYTQRQMFVQKTKPFRDTLNYLHTMLMVNLKKTETDSSIIDSLLHQITKHQSCIQRFAFKALAEEKALLNPEQQEQFLNLFENHVCNFSILRYGPFMKGGGGSCNKHMNSDAP